MSGKGSRGTAEPPSFKMLSSPGRENGYHAQTTIDYSLPQTAQAAKNFGIGGAGTRRILVIQPEQCVAQLGDERR